MSEKQIKISAAVIFNQQGQTLLVRKTGTPFFMQPGGKIDEGESAQAALIRELQEELELSTSASQLKSLGTFSAVAANEANHVVVAELFLLGCTFSPKPANEIAEAVWITPSQAKALELAPLTRNHVMPILENMGLELQ